MDAAEVAEQAELQLRHVLSELSGEPVASADGPTAYGRLRAEQGMPLEVVLHAYRVAWAELWDGLLSGAQADGPTGEELLRASTEFFWMADEYAQRMLVSYRQRAIELLVTDEAERAATLEGVFSGYLHGVEALWEAAALLDLPYDGLFVVVAAQTPAPAREALPGIKAALRAISLGSAWRLGPDLEVGIVSLRVEEALATLMQELTGRGEVRAGLSSLYTSLADTPHALHLARLTLGTLPPGHGAIKRFDDNPVAALLAASPRTAGVLVRSVLGGLMELPDEDRESLLLTLSTWFEAAGSITETAKRLYVHPNTVRYRMRRVQTQTGRPLEDPKAVADISAALLAYRMIPTVDGQH
jgi:DNA-binding PucR family transcriptional regulator